MFDFLDTQKKYRDKDKKTNEKQPEKSKIQSKNVKIVKTLLTKGPIHATGEAVGGIVKKRAKKKPLHKKDQKVFDKLINEGIESDVLLPHFEMVNESSAGGALAGAMLFGPIGAVLGGSSHSESKPVHRRNILKLAEKGILIKNAESDGTDLRIPWSKIANVEISPRKREIIKLRQFFILTLENTSKLQFDLSTAVNIGYGGGRSENKYKHLKVKYPHRLREHILEYLRDNATGKLIEDDGW